MRETEIRPDSLMDGQREAYARDLERVLRRREEFVSIPCPSCGSNNKEPLFQKLSLDYVRCADCRMAFMDPRPSPLVLDEYYATSENYEYWNEHIFPASEATRREKIFRPRVDRVVSFADTYGVGQDTLVDVGAGFGTFCEEMQDRGRFARTVALEPTPSLARACRNRGLEVWDRPIETIEEDLGMADIVTAFEVIEHLFDPAVLFAKCRDLLKAGGLLVITCPNAEGFDMQALGPLSDTIDLEHLNYFTPTSLPSLAEHNGFQVLEVLTPGELDVELVRKAVLRGDVDLSGQPFLERVLLTEWEGLGAAFQAFLRDNGLSSHLWLVAKKRN